MERREGADLLHGADHGVVDHRRLDETGPSLDDAMTHGGDLDLIQTWTVGVARLDHGPEPGDVVQHRSLEDVLLSIRRGVVDHAVIGADSLDQPLGQELLGIHVDDLVLDR